MSIAQTAITPDIAAVLAAAGISTPKIDSIMRTVEREQAANRLAETLTSDLVLTLASIIPLKESKSGWIGHAASTKVSTPEGDYRVRVVLTPITGDDTDDDETAMDAAGVPPLPQV